MNMDLRSNPFNDAWAAFSDNKEPWRRILVDSIGEIKVFGTLSSPDNSEAVLVTSPVLCSYSGDLPSGKGFNVSLCELDGTNHLLIAKNSGADISLFSTMVFDVFSSLKTPSVLPESALIDRMMIRIKSWQEFMRKGSSKLSKEYELGLIGELQCIIDMIRLVSNAEDVICHWVGPFRGVQDFIFDMGAVEVKTTSSAESFHAKINSLEQLDEFFISPIYLFGYRIQERSNGLTLNDFVDSVRELLMSDQGSLNKFNSSVIAAGYLDEHKNEYKRQFERVEVLIWKMGPEFPKLSSTNTHSAVVKATYSIDLNQITHDETLIDEVLATLGVK